jgi:hypothetical protein
MLAHFHTCPQTFYTCRILLVKNIFVYPSKQKLMFLCYFNLQICMHKVKSTSYYRKQFMLYIPSATCWTQRSQVVYNFLKLYPYVNSCIQPISVFFVAPHFANTVSYSYVDGNESSFFTWIQNVWKLFLQTIQKVNHRNIFVCTVHTTREVCSEVQAGEGGDLTVHAHSTYSYSKHIALPVSPLVQCIMEMVLQGWMHVLWV